MNISKVINVHQPPSALLLAAPFIVEGRASREVNRVLLVDPEVGSVYTFEFVGDVNDEQSLVAKLEVRQRYIGSRQMFMLSSCFCQCTVQLRSAGTEAVVWAREEIDFETLGPFHQLTIRATDVGYPDVFLEQDFNVTLLDVPEADVTLANGECVWLTFAFTARVFILNFAHILFQTSFPGREFCERHHRRRTCSRR